MLDFLVSTLILLSYAMKEIKILLIILFFSGCLPIPQQKRAAPMEISVHFINVGQGDAIFIDTAKDDMLIDCGNNGKGGVILDYLQDLGVQDIKYLVITHIHPDHIGGCDEILRGIIVDKVLMDGQGDRSDSYRDVIKEIDIEELIIPETGYDSSLDSARWEVLKANIDSNNPNENSIVIRLIYGDIGFLFTGDCDEACEDEFLDDDIDVEVLKVAHHGCKDGTDNDFLQKTTPEIAIIQVAAINKFGKPHQECIDRLEAAGVKIYRNDLNGNIIVKTNGNKYTVETTLPLLKQRFKDSLNSRTRGVLESMSIFRENSGN